MKINQLNKLIETYLNEGFIEKTGLPLYDNILSNPSYFLNEKNVQSEVIQMSPDEYIQKCAEAMNVTTESLVSERQDKSLRQLIYALHRNETIFMPYLHYTKEGFAQEGLHRALAAKECNIQEIPVLVVKEL